MGFHPFENCHFLINRQFLYRSFPNGTFEIITLRPGKYDSLEFAWKWFPKATCQVYLLKSYTKLLYQTHHHRHHKRLLTSKVPNSMPIVRCSMLAMMMITIIERIIRRRRRTMIIRVIIVMIIMVMIMTIIIQTIHDPSPKVVDQC